MVADSEVTSESAPNPVHRPALTRAVGTSETGAFEPHLAS